MTQTKLKNYEDSESALKEIKKFLRSKDANVFILTGYAGTGKTTLVSKITEYITNNYEKIADSDLPIRPNDYSEYLSLMAPTGNAARILARKTKLNTTTIHKKIYYFDFIKTMEASYFPEEDPPGETDSQEEYQYFDLYLKFNTSEDLIRVPLKIYIIDEASMISDKAQAKHNFLSFGSGKLLNDIIIHTRINEGKSKIIFVGDPAQLPPVDNSVFNPALSPTYLEKKYGLKVKTAQLHIIKRQEEGSKILKEAEKIRSPLTSLNFYKFKIKGDKIKGDKKEIIKLDDREALIEEYIKDPLNGVIICYTNEDVDKYNADIRKKLFENPRIPLQNNDIIMVIQNNYKYDLLNGDFVQITATKGESLKIHPREEFGSSQYYEIFGDNNQYLKREIPMQNGKYLCWQKVKIKYLEDNNEEEKEILIVLNPLININQRNDDFPFYGETILQKWLWLDLQARRKDEMDLFHRKIMKLRKKKFDKLMRELTHIAQNDEQTLKENEELDLAKFRSETKEWILLFKILNLNLDRRTLKDKSKFFISKQRELLFNIQEITIEISRQVFNHYKSRIIRIIKNYKPHIIKNYKPQNTKKNNRIIELSIKDILDDLSAFINTSTVETKEAFLADIIAKIFILFGYFYREILQTDILFNAVIAKYGYSVTCHKAQGNEWDNVFIDWSKRYYKDTIAQDEFFRWAYTAITRARKKIITLNTPYFDAASRIDESTIEDYKSKLLQNYRQTLKEIQDSYSNKLKVGYIMHKTHISSKEILSKVSEKEIIKSIFYPYNKGLWTHREFVEIVKDIIDKSELLQEVLDSESEGSAVEDFITAYLTDAPLSVTVISLFSSYAKALNNIGNTLYIEKNLPNMRKIFYNHIHIDKREYERNNTYFIRNFADSYVIIGEKATAAKLILQYIKQHPKEALEKPEFGQIWNLLKNIYEDYYLAINPKIQHIKQNKETYRELVLLQLEFWKKAAELLKKEYNKTYFFANSSSLIGYVVNNLLLNSKKGARKRTDFEKQLIYIAAEQITSFTEVFRNLSRISRKQRKYYNKVERYARRLKNIMTPTLFQDYTPKTNLLGNFMENLENMNLDF